MRDISRKVVTHRTAVAKAVLRLEPEIIDRIRRKEIPKGDPLEIAKMAAIQAAKNTYQLIPYCHQIPIEFVGVDFNVEDRIITIETKVKASYKTGVEMEAMTAASVAALTIYDMVKMFDREARIESVELLRKTGGKSNFEGDHSRVFRAACLVMSDRISKGEGEDRSGAIIVEKLRQHGIDVVEHKVIADDKELIADEIRRLADEVKV
ncbi:MAG: cyclic pyranopterin monophosphate synthase MoaC, partial [Cyanobacteria bacterium]|nr:cyclic pyranopterin monophosphate synthase MoaC [Cyanobacteriota bacterium]